MLTKNEIEVIAKKIAEIVPAKEIILFGSYAKGENKEDSDIDLCVLVDDEKVEQMSLMQKIYLELDSKYYKIPMDILVYSLKRFRERSSLSVTFEHEIKETGVKIYG